MADKALPRRLQGTDPGPPHLRPDPFWTDGAPGHWVVHWRIHNERRAPVHLKSALQPHARFRSPETRIERDIPARGSLDLALPVRFVEKPGDIVENPFLILRVSSDGVDWQVLIRVTVTAGSRGEPAAGNMLSLSVNRVGAV